jgi:hypothetical protein
MGDLVPQDNLDDANEFSNETVGQNIPPEYIPAIEKVAGSPFPFPLPFFS